MVENDETFPVDQDGLYPLVVTRLARQVWSVFNRITKQTFRTYGKPPAVYANMKKQAEEWREVRIDADGNVIPPEQCTRFSKVWINKCRQGAAKRYGKGGRTA